MRSALLALGSWLLASIASAQVPAAAPVTATVGDVTFTVASINESRPIGGTGGISISVTLTSPKFSPNASVRSSRVTKAIDDQGRNLASMAPARGGIAIGAPARGSGPPTLRTALMLNMSARDAETIKLLEGEIEVLNPSTTTGPSVVISDASKRVGKPFDAAELTKLGIEFTILTPESYPAIQGQYPVLAARTPSFEAGPVVYVKDPNSRISRYQFQDLDKSVIFVTQSSITTRDGKLTENRFGTPAAKDYQIAFFLSGEEAVITVPVHLENIELP